MCSSPSVAKGKDHLHVARRRDARAVHLPWPPPRPRCTWDQGAKVSSPRDYRVDVRQQHRTLHERQKCSTSQPLTASSRLVYAAITRRRSILHRQRRSLPGLNKQGMSHLSCPISPCKTMSPHSYHPRPTRLRHLAPLAIRKKCHSEKTNSRHNQACKA
jgi:hypothetical protein